MIILTISLVRALIIYSVVIICMRVMGKRQISQLQTSELVVTLLISDVAAIPMQNSEQNLVSGLIPIFVLVACEIIVSIIMMKSTKFRKLICGSPVVIVDDGKIIQKEFTRLRINVEDLEEQLRQLDVASIHDVAYAIVETNGKLSIIKKSPKQVPDCLTLGINSPEAVIDTVVVSDGTVSDFSLNLCGLSREWIYEYLNKKNLLLKDIFIMTANKNREVRIIKKRES